MCFSYNTDIQYIYIYLFIYSSFFFWHSVNAAREVAATLHKAAASPSVHQSTYRQDGSVMNVCFTLRLPFDLLQAGCPAPCSASHFLLALQLNHANNHSPINSNGSATLLCLCRSV